MWNKYNLLFEIGSEEIPAGYIPPSIDNIKKMFTAKLLEQRIDCAAVDVYATPRRLVLCAAGVADAQREEMIELKGPSADRAYDADGKPSQALSGFLKGNGLSEKEIEKRETPKGAYYFGMKKADSKPSVEILPELFLSIIKELPFPKKMRWSDRTVGYPRPIRYITALFNDKIVNFDLEGLASSNKTRGHYVQSPAMIEIKKISEYETKLKAAKVILNQTERKENIRTQLASVAKKLNANLVEDEELLDTVTYLTEDPHVIVCEFNPDFLKIPDIVLITEMREHQKYFAVRDKSGKLTNKFLVTANNPESKNVREGNERVIKARFTDGEFFFNEDRKHKLVDKVESLKTVVFHKELGTIYDKVVRVQKIASIVGDELKLNDKDRKNIDRAVLLSKADLNTAMVMEFTSLQGKIGQIYATMDGEDPAVAAAIEDHYRPRFQGDEIPKNIVSIVLSLSEKIDNILGSYSVGNIPKGSQDPYALRRQSNAAVDMLIKNKLNLDVSRVLKSASSMYKDGATLLDKILEFINGRVNTIFQDAGFSYDEIDAVLSTGNYDYRELFVRAESVHAFRKNESFSKMLLGFKRMNNIYSSFTAKNKGYALSFDKSLLAVDAEKALFTFFDSKKKDIDGFIKTNDYEKLFNVLIDAKPVIDTFFDKVMVMDQDVKVRDNRLALLDSILKPFAGLIDFSKIAD